MSSEKIGDLKGNCFNPVFVIERVELGKDRRGSCLEATFL
jgi:hypothetical protein